MWFSFVENIVYFSKPTFPRCGIITTFRMITKKIVGDEIEVTFTLPTAIEAESAFLVGDFNDWSLSATPLLRTSDRNWTVTIRLPLNRIFEFRYYVNNGEWQNDWSADGYKKNPYGSDNSVIRTVIEEKK
jgi:1,4-alpha-glucan branching enzyme